MERTGYLPFVVGAVCVSLVVGCAAEGGGAAPTSSESGGAGGAVGGAPSGGASGAGPAGSAGARAGAAGTAGGGSGGFGTGGGSAGAGGQPPAAGSGGQPPAAGSGGQVAAGGSGGQVAFAGSGGQAAAGAGGQVAAAGAGGQAGALGQDEAPIGYAAEGEGTTGGFGGKVVKVKTHDELVAAVGGTQPKIILITADIALDGGKDWVGKTHAEQSAYVVIKVGSNKTIRGARDGGTGAVTLNGGSFLLEGSNNVILQNLVVEDAWDANPEWADGGGWKSSYDNVTLRNSTHVWIDHCSFSDGDRPDDPTDLRVPDGQGGTKVDKKNGERYLHHDGLVDITVKSDWVTVSWSQLRDHDKTALIGAGDSETDDAGKLHVTLHHNYFRNSKQRSPRVRFGHVHLFNNVYEGDKDVVSYAIGIGVFSNIYSERNTFDIPGGDLFGIEADSGAFLDQGSWVGGKTNVGALTFKSKATATPVDYPYSLDEVSVVEALVKAGAGAAK
jgi:pectate lyase